MLGYHRGFHAGNYADDKRYRNLIIESWKTVSLSGLRHQAADGNTGNLEGIANGDHPPDWNAFSRLPEYVNIARQPAWARQSATHRVYQFHYCARNSRWKPLTATESQPRSIIDRYGAKPTTVNPRDCRIISGAPPAN